MLHYYARRFFAPNAISMSMEFSNLTVYVIRDPFGGQTPRETSSSLTLCCHSWNSFKPKSSKQYPVRLVSTIIAHVNLLLWFTYEVVCNPIVTCRPLCSNSQQVLHSFFGNLESC